MSVSEEQSHSLPPGMVCRGVRGATTVEANTAEAILAGTQELLEALVEANGIQVEDVASIFFTTTVDLDATYPALAARRMGWTETALLCAHEIDVPGGLPQVIRILLHWNCTRALADVVHVYLGEAQSLRPDRHNGHQPSQAANGDRSTTLIDRIGS